MEKCFFQIQIRGCFVRKNLSLTLHAVRANKAILQPHEKQYTLMFAKSKAALEEGLLHISKSIPLPAGYYVVRAETEGAATIAKLIIQNH